MIIAFTGGMGTGKTTAANIVIATYENAYKKSFAAPVKEIATTCFGWDGEKDEKGRKLLQVIVTEAGRAYDPDIWANKMHEEINARYILDLDLIVIDDLRFDNEADLIHRLGGKVILIKRNTGIKSDHASEQGIKNYDIAIENNGDAAELKERLLEILKPLINE